jgi:hypothetical protein
MDSLQNIMASHRFETPDEAKTLKNYIKSKYGSDARIKVDDSSVIVSVASSALAATLQLNKDNIAKECGIKKRLVIRTGR